MTSCHSAEPTSANRQLQFDWSARNLNDNRPLALPAPTTNTTAVESAEPSVPPTLQQSPGRQDDTRRDYDPGHPWHYLACGDRATPVPFDAIPPARDYDRSLERELPRPTAKRIVRAREILASERRDLEEARCRYEDVIARGADALSRYDRDIAYGGNDELARAGTLALLFNQIAWRRGRIAFLERIECSRTTRQR